MSLPLASHLRGGGGARGGARGGGGASVVDLADNALAQEVAGAADANFATLARVLGVRVAARGSRVAVRGAPVARALARRVVLGLAARARAGLAVDATAIEAALALDAATIEAGFAPHTPHRGGIAPRGPGQVALAEALETATLTIAMGPAGTGKTLLVARAAARALASGAVDKVVVCRPALEAAGERLGYLPGDAQEKTAPYLRPLVAALEQVMTPEGLAQAMAAGRVETVALAFVRGRTFERAFIALDEAQNATPTQMLLFLTRMGLGARFALAGDPTQTDLPAGVVSGLADAVRRLEGEAGVTVARLDARDMARHPLVARVVAAYARP